MPSTRSSNMLVPESGSPAARAVPDDARENTVDAAAAQAGDVYHRRPRGGSLLEQRSMSRSYLYSLIAMAVLPVFVLASLWIADLRREFEQRSDAWRRAYVETQKQSLARQVADVLDNLAFESASLEAAQREQLKLEVDNGIAQLDGLLREAGPADSRRQMTREQLLRRARDLLAPLRFGAGRDHFFIHTLDGIAVLMPAYPQWQGGNVGDRRDANGVDFVARFQALARGVGDGYLDVWYAGLADANGGRAGSRARAPAAAGNAYLTTQYIRYYAPLDIYVGAVGYMDDMLAAVQREELARLASAAADDSTLTVVDRRGAILLDRRLLEGAIAAPAAADAAYWAQLRAVNAPEGFLRLQRTRPGASAPSPVLVVVRTYGGWQWRVAATYFLDDLEKDIAEQRAALQQRIERRMWQISGTVLALVVVAVLIALRWARRMRAAMQRFADLCAAANASGSAVDIGRVPVREFEQLAVDANRMIEQRNRIESELRESERRFEMALSASGSHLWDMSLVDHTIVMNGSLYRQLGYPESGTLIGVEQWRALVHPDDLQSVIESMGRLAVPEQYGVEFRARDSQGNYRWMLARGAAVEFDAGGAPTRALGTIIEITDRKRMEQELVAARIAAEDANHAKSQFLSSISHELRTPLNGVLGYAQILLRDRGISAEHRHNLRAIESCGQHLLTLINDVLDLAKIESGKIDIDERPCDLYDLLDNVSNIVRERLESKGLSWTLEIGPSVPAVICIDEVKLRQILVNLLGNAVKFTARGGVKLRVVVDRIGSELLFEVHDTGIGIAEDKQREIFFPFHQVGPSAGGTGLGLPISLRLCEAMGGRMGVRSTPGAGSCFSFNLPMKISMRALMPQQSNTGHQVIDTGGRATSVLVVDDNQVNRQVLGGMLRASGIAIVEAENGQHALDVLRDRRQRGEPLPLVLMDVRMPVMDGFAATRAIRADPQLRDTVVIAVSASVFPDVVSRMREEGCDDFVSKPVRIGELLEVVARYLDLPLRQIPARTEPVGATLPAALREALRAALAVGDIEALRALLPALRGMPGLESWTRELERRLDHFDLDAVGELLSERATQ